MKNIHVILICYPYSSLLHRGMASLQFISDSVEGVTVLGEKDDAFRRYSCLYNINFIKVNDNNLGFNLEAHVRTISTEYILILHDGNALNANIRKLSLNLPEDQQMIAYFHTIKNKTIQYPFLIRTTFIKRTLFFSRYRFPFSEAILPAWVASLKKTGIVFLEGDFITSLKNEGTANALPIIEFIEKFQKRETFKKQAHSISIILAHFNMDQYVGTALSSCLLQTSPAEQILVMDDGSTDISKKELEKWKDYPGIDIFQKENGGKARALNDLLPHIQTDFVLELDADDWLDPDALMIIRNQLLSLSDDAVVLYGNLRTWKQRRPGSLLYKGIRKGHPVRNRGELLSYHFPLGPRIYRSTALKTNGFPVIEFEDGRMYEDVSVLNHLLKRGRLVYKDFTVYNVREHPSSITKRNRSNWNDFLKFLD